MVTSSPDFKLFFVFFRVRRSGFQQTAPAVPGAENKIVKP